MITGIVAYNRNFAIGDSEGKVPWKIKEELDFFKQTTMGHPVIMGRKTWDSLPAKFRPLPGRHNVVVSRKYMDFKFPPECLDTLSVMPNIEMAIDAAKSRNGNGEIFVIGGSEIYHYCIAHQLLERFLVSEVKEYLHVDAMAFFPDLLKLGWWRKVIREEQQFVIAEFLPPAKN